MQNPNQFEYLSKLSQSIKSEINPNSTLQKSQNSAKINSSVDPNKNLWNDFRSNTGQFCNSNEKNFINNNTEFFSNNTKIRKSYYEEEPLYPNKQNWFKNPYSLEQKLREQNEIIERTSIVPPNFKIGYIEYEQLPHISQYNPSLNR